MHRGILNCSLFRALGGVVLLYACAPFVSQQVRPLTIHSSSAASPWLETAYDCTPVSAAVALSDGPDADLELRLGPPDDLVDAAFEIGIDEILVVTHPEVGVGSLPALQVEALFTGQISNWREIGGAEQLVEVWSYAPDTDVQAYFARAVLHDRPVSSLARLAVSAQHMSDSVGASPGAIGLLPRRWKAGNTREVLVVGSLPVLAIPRETPRGPIAELISCMQSRH